MVHVLPLFPEKSWFLFGFSREPDFVAVEPTAAAPIIRPVTVLDGVMVGKQHLLSVGVTNSAHK
jgi:hypothetical protein